MHTEALLLAAEGEATNPLIPAIYDIVWSLIPFALVLFLFWRVVLPRLQKTLDERSQAIEGGIAEAQSAQLEAKEALDKYNKLLAMPALKHLKSVIRLALRAIRFLLS